MADPTTNGIGPAKSGWPDPIVVSRPGAVLHTEVIPLEGELRQALTVTPSPPRPRRRDSIFDENGYLKPPRLPRPENLRWWERLAYAWRGL
ncbi:MAG TPA: hypothetical protein VHG93_22300 [Longimicrobium sp.]|nr:hypothetical protein [Longimicrobium sp.]